MRIFINQFDEQFLELHNRSCQFVKKIPNDKLFWKPRETKHDFVRFSCGAYILRSAGTVEQTFGGITSRLWDDPFEWTLPEELSITDKISEYLAEVEATRQKGFAFFASDEDLKKELPAPEKLKSIFEILLETAARAEHFQGRAFAIFQMFSDERLPII
ncbi:MAG: hypothetical protein H0W58_00820 [Acidobacteria bacterium]|nr:hypothetical protein [Acidobacteriota bacterium]